MLAMHDALLRHNQQVPRYTSYPTAPHFGTAVTSAVFSDWLAALPKDAGLSLYFHVPYCRKICWYCGCFTKASQKYEPVSDYVDLVCQEIELVRAKISGEQTVRHIHFGGGSPSILTPIDFSRIMDLVRSRFQVAEDAEIAIELDPREVREAKVAAYAQAGVTRASLGVQDFHENVQRAIGRVQPFHMVYEAVNLLRRYDITRINMDLLYGLPHQSVATIDENIDFAAALNPDRIALFGYAHVPWMKKHMRLIDESALPGSKERLHQFDAACQKLAARGYQAIGLDHFVRGNDPMAKAYESHTLKRNFQGYTTDAADALIGFGPSAISALPQGYAQNTLANHDYAAALAAGHHPIVKGRTLTAEDNIRRAAIEELMCYFTLDLDTFCAGLGLAPDHLDSALPRLAELQEDGLVHLAGRTITVPATARQAVRLVCAAFDAYLDINPKRHAQVA